MRATTTLLGATLAATTLAMVVQAFAPPTLVATSRTAVPGSCKWKVLQPALPGTSLERAWHDTCRVTTANSARA